MGNFKLPRDSYFKKHYPTITVDDHFDNATKIVFLYNWPGPRVA